MWSSIKNWLREVYRYLTKPSTPKDPIVIDPVTPIPTGPISGNDPREGTPPWYREMFRICFVNPGKERMLNDAIALIENGMNRYVTTAHLLGPMPHDRMFYAYILGVLHYKEATCDFRGVLHNGEKIIGTGKKTRLVPAGHGPFETWEMAAIDALKLNGARWSKIVKGSDNIGDVLEAIEKYNGLGYIRGPGRDENSPYLWSCSNINDGFGKYVSDGKYDSRAPTDRTVGAALILKELYNRKKFKCSGVN